MNSRQTLQVYVSQIKKIPRLEGDEELDMVRRARQGDCAARNRLIESNLRLVLKLSNQRKYAPFLACYHMDMLQEGNLGLLQAVERFDEQRGFRFSTYATFWINHFFERFIHNKSRTVRIPVYKEEVISRIKKAVVRLEMLLCRTPSQQEVADDLHLTSAEVSDTYKTMREATCEDLFMIDKEAPSTEYEKYNPERQAMKKACCEDVEELLAKLSDKEATVIKLRYAFGTERHTLKECGKKMKISSEMVRQIEGNAIKKLSVHRKLLADYTSGGGQ